jgi:hypothetical protein
VKPVEAAQQGLSMVRATWQTYLLALVVTPLDSLLDSDLLASAMRSVTSHWPRIVVTGGANLRHLLLVVATAASIFVLAANARTYRDTAFSFQRWVYAGGTFFFRTLGAVITPVVFIVMTMLTAMLFPPLAILAFPIALLLIPKAVVRAVEEGTTTRIAITRAANDLITAPGLHLVSALLILVPCTLLSGSMAGWRSQMPMLAIVATVAQQVLMPFFYCWLLATNAVIANDSVV